MKKNRKYFILNKESDFIRGSATGICVDGGILPNTDYRCGIYYTEIFDSGERMMSWHRLTVTGTMPKGTEVCAQVYTSDSLFCGKGNDGAAGSILDIITDCAKTQEEKDEILRPFLRASFDYPEDVLLFGIYGRYLWLKIAMRPAADAFPVIKKIRVCFPKQTWLSYLPEIYGADPKSASFLERYLGIFQTIYEDMTDQIDSMTRLLEPSLEREENLLWLADWFSFEGTKIWNKKQLFYLVKNAMRIYQSRGTVACLNELVELYTGTQPLLVEYHAILPYFDGGIVERILKELYTSSHYEFALLFTGEQDGRESKLFGLEQVIEMAKPAHMKCRIIVLRQYIFLNRHSYLGINSVLGQYRPFCLDGLSAVSFSVISFDVTDRV